MIGAVFSKGPAHGLSDRLLELICVRVFGAAPKPGLGLFLVPEGEKPCPWGTWSMSVEDVPWKGLTAGVADLKGLTPDSRETDGLHRLPGDEPGDAKGLVAGAAASKGLSPKGCGAEASA